MEMTPARWRATEAYSAEVFGRQDGVLEEARAAAAEAGLPDIAVTPDVGRLLMILASLTRGRLAVEVGTLGGYSGIWLTRGLAPGGRLITIEMDSRHAGVAQEQFDRAGLSDRIEVRIGAALQVLPALAEELGPGSVDVAFIDAAKEEYPEYFALLRPLIAPGGLLLADNVYGAAGSWIDRIDRPGIAAVDRMNRLVAAAPEFEAVAVPIRAGLLIARRTK